MQWRLKVRAFGYHKPLENLRNSTGQANYITRSISSFSELGEIVNCLCPSAPANRAEVIMLSKYLIFSSPIDKKHHELREMGSIAGVFPAWVISFKITLSCGVVVSQKSRLTNIKCVCATPYFSETNLDGLCFFLFHFFQKIDCSAVKKELINAS